MKKSNLKLLAVLFIGILIPLQLLAGNFDFKKYIPKNHWVMSFSYNTISKSENSYSYLLNFDYDLKYQIMVFSTNPDITVSVWDSSETNILKKAKKSVFKDGYYFFFLEMDAYKGEDQNVEIKTNKSQYFEYYFLATYEATTIPDEQKQMIDAYQKFSKKLFAMEKYTINQKNYSKKILGFTYFPSNQFDRRYMYQNNVYMVQSFIDRIEHNLNFYEGEKADPKKRIQVTVNSDKLGRGFEGFSSKYFVTTIKKKKSLYYSKINCDCFSVIIISQLFEDIPDLANEIKLTKPLPEKTNNLLVNLAAYVTNWEKSPENFVVVKRMNGNDKTEFKLDTNFTGNVFNFDLNLPLLPGDNKLIIEAHIKGRIKTLEKNVFAESVKKSLLVELTWDTPGTDLDLYVVKPDGNVVCFENQNEGNPSKGWLDIDAKDGYGPERFRMDSPPKGRYKIYAHYYNGNVPTNAFAKIVTLGNILEFKALLKTSNKINSFVGNADNSPDWVLLGEAEVK